MNMTLAAMVLATLPSTIVDKTAPDTAVRLVTGKDIGETLRKGMTPDALFSQVLLAKRDGYEIHITSRDKSGGAEIHENWSDHIFIQEGDASFRHRRDCAGCQSHGAGRKTRRCRHRWPHHGRAGRRLLVYSARDTAPDDVETRPAGDIHRAADTQVGEAWSAISEGH